MKVLAVTLFALALAAPAHALTLKEKKQYKAWEDYLKDPKESHIASVKEKCGIDLPVTLDEKFTTPFMEANTNAASYCDEAISGIANTCGDELGKKAVTEKIKKLSCVLGTKGEAAFKLKGTELEFSYGQGASNLGDKTKAFLENHL